MRVDQVVVGAAPHDAVTTHALSLQAGLATRHESELFARYVHPGVEGRVRPLETFGGERRDALIVHVSIGEPDVAAFLAGRAEPLVVVYHNLTPPELVERWDPRLAGLLRSGRSELGALASRAVLGVGVSEYNAGELEALGFSSVAVAPLVTARDRLTEVTPDASMQALMQGLDAPVMASVGRVMPHKRPDFLVQALHALRTYVAPVGSLVFAGGTTVPAYAAAVAQYAAELALPHVRLLGEVDDAALAAVYRGADLFVTASEHEGFCAPIEEAMGLDLPVMARGFAAVPETLGGAGALLAPTDGPAVFAEAAHAISSDPRLRVGLVAAGRARHRQMGAVDRVGVFLSQLEAALE